MRQCLHCVDPRTNRCIAIRDRQGEGYLPDGTTRLRRGEEPLRHFMGTSTFAEATVMPEIALAKVSPDASFAGAAVFACGLSTGIGAALFTAKVQPGSTVAVFGCGLVGLGAVIGARLAGAERITAIDLSEGRLAHARHHGATDTLVGGPDTVADAQGADRRVRLRLHLRGDGQRRGHAPGGRGGARGLGPRDDVRGRRARASCSRSSRGCLITGRRVTGSSFGGVKGRSGVPVLVDRWLAGEIDVDDLLSHRMGLDDVNHAFELMEAQDGIRTILEIT